jgi:uncharacterized protein YndB with AHSA1/START domain
LSENAMVSRIENEKVLVMERVFEAPCELLFEMYKMPAHLRHWWGPRGWELPVCTVDFRPGGAWFYCMKCVDRNQGQYYGTQSCGKAVYREIAEPGKLRYTDYFTDEAGNIDEAMPSNEVLVEFIDQGGRTKLVSRSEPASAQALQSLLDTGMLQGFTETWDRLEEYLRELTK